MQEPDLAHYAVLRVNDRPSPQVVALFREAFPRHPAAQLRERLAREFLSAFARVGIVLVVADCRTGDEVGFAVGGVATELDRTRRRFIRANAWRIAFSLLRRRSFTRHLRGRVRRRRPLRVAHAPYQLRFIAVHRRARGLGIGTLLLNAFESELPPDTVYHAWTLHGPHGAERFYIARGFHCDVNIDGHLRFCKRL